MHANFYYEPSETKIAESIKTARKVWRMARRDAKFYPPKPVTPVIAKTNLDTDVLMNCARSVAFFDPFGDAQYLTVNNIDYGCDLDGAVEFNDSDGSDELSSLTIVEPGHGNIRRWLKGYNIL